MSSPRSALDECRIEDLAALPVAASALGAGELSSSALDLLASARARCPEAHPQGEEALVEAARTMAPRRALCRNLDTWRIDADRELALEDEDRAFEQRHLDVVPTAADSFGVLKARRVAARGAGSAADLTAPRGPDVPRE